MKSNDTSSRSPSSTHVHAADGAPVMPKKFHFKDVGAAYRACQERRRQAGKLVLPDTFIAGRNNRNKKG